MCIALIEWLSFPANPPPAGLPSDFVAPTSRGFHFRHRAASAMEHRRIHIEPLRRPPTLTTRGGARFPHPTVFF